MVNVSGETKSELAYVGGGTLRRWAWGQAWVSNAGKRLKQTGRAIQCLGLICSSDTGSILLRETGRKDEPRGNENRDGESESGDASESGILWPQRSRPDDDDPVSLPLLLGVLDSTTALGNPGQYSLPVNFHHVTVERSLEPSAGLQRSLILVVGSPSLLVPLVHCQIIFHFAGLIRTRSLPQDFCLFLALFSVQAILLVTFVQR